MITILADHNIEGQAALLWGTLAANGWLELLPIRLVTFAQVGLAVKSSDRVVWRYVQAHRMVLLTDNRNMSGNDSLQRTLQEENTLSSLPVLTIGSRDRMHQRDYRERCAERLVEIVIEIDTYLGSSRLFIP